MKLKSLFWLGNSKENLKEFPAKVRDVVGYALYLAQAGEKHPDAKPLKGFKGAGVLEVADNHDGNAYRVIYSVKFSNAVFVLHAFQKKSKRGISTPKAEIEIIKMRLKKIKEHIR